MTRTLSGSDLVLLIMCAPESNEPGIGLLDAADRLARAADRWVRRGVATGEFSFHDARARAREDLAAGLIDGLCEALDLGRDHVIFALYIYAIINNDDHFAEDLARGDLAAGSVGEFYQMGRSEAIVLLSEVARPLN